ncbi:MAG: heavy-metal-associated domain-containing protein [Bryobacteraceae bacterium]
MTCAHVVYVALKKVPGVDSVDVSLNKGLATVKLKPGNTVTVPQLWKLIHDQGYTPKATTVLVRGELSGDSAKPQLKVTGANVVIPLAPNTRDPAAYRQLSNSVGQRVTLRGVLNPAKDFKIPVDLQVTEIMPSAQKGT